MNLTKSGFERSISAFNISQWLSAGPGKVDAIYGEPFTRMVGYSQNNPHHCYDLWKHTIHTIKALPEDASVRLRVAAFLHDIGKPDVAVEKAPGRVIYHGHAKKSAEIADDVLRKLGYAESERKEILFLVSHHDDFVSWVIPGSPVSLANPELPTITEENVRKYIEKHKKGNDLPEGIWRELLTLVYADNSAQAEKVYVGSGVITRESKLEKVRMLIALLPEEGRCA